MRSSRVNLKLVALGVGVFDAIAKMGAYFVHERVWAKIKWGAAKPPDYQI